MGRNVKSRSYLDKCLFCFGACDGDEFTTFQGGIVGAVGCDFLEVQLQQYFIVSQLLDIPSKWCEETLEKTQGPESWFTVCPKCFLKVDAAWQVHQTMLRLEQKMKMIKSRMRDKMRQAGRNRESVLIKSKGLRELNGNVADEIRALACPDLYKETESPRRSRFTGTYEDPDSVRNDMNEDAADEWVPDFQSGYESSDSVNKGDSSNKPLPRSPRVKQEKSFRTEEDGDEQAFFNELVGNELVGQTQRRSPKTNKKKGRRSRYKCDICPAKFKNVEDLEKHQALHEENKQNGGELECQICRYPFMEQANLRRHMALKHGSSNPTTSSENEVCIRVKQFSCTECEFVTEEEDMIKSWASLKKHVHSTHPNTADNILKPEFHFVCGTCCKPCMSLNSLINHEKRMHPALYGVPEEPISCDQCSMLFPSRIRLQYHIQNTHKRITREICDVCGVGFVNRKKMLRHKVRHEKGKQEFVCDLCGGQFAYWESLLKHNKKFHANEENEGGVAEGEQQSEYKCKYCDMVFHSKIVMIQHSASHKKEMGHQCDICSKYYANAQGLKRHKRLNHSSGGEKVKCNYCFKEFDNVDYMKSHVLKYCKIKRLQCSSGQPIVPSNTTQEQGIASEGPPSIQPISFAFESGQVEVELQKMEIDMQ